jgi:hypothetical protein
MFEDAVFEGIAKILVRVSLEYGGVVKGFNWVDIPPLRLR